MSTQIDWQRELDASFGSGDDVPVGHYVAVGHHAVRRRRTRTAVAGLAAAAVVVGTTWALAPGGSPRSDDAPLATEPTSDATTTAEQSRAWPEGDPPARYGGAGVEIRDGAVVHERRDDLYPGKDTDSVALDVSYRGERYWIAIEWGDGSGASQSVQPQDGLFEDFDAFVRDLVQGGGMIVARPDDGPTRSEELVTWHGGELDPAPGVTVMRRVDDPVPGDDSLGLVLHSHGVTTWMLLTEGGEAASWSLESDSGWSTFDQWLADQVALTSDEPAPTLVDLEDDGAVTPALGGVEVLDQQTDPDLRAYGTAAQGAVSAVAMVEWQDARWFVLAIGGNGPASVTTVAASKAGGATTLDDFVAFMAERADEGGMR